VAHCWSTVVLSEIPLKAASIVYMKLYTFIWSHSSIISSRLRSYWCHITPALWWPILWTDGSKLPLFSFTSQINCALKVNGINYSFQKASLTSTNGRWPYRFQSGCKSQLCGEATDVSSSSCLHRDLGVVERDWNTQYGWKVHGFSL